MDFSVLKNFNKKVWYRGYKNLTTTIINQNTIKFSNGDILCFINNEFFLNKKLISNIPDLTIEELIHIYYEYLKIKGYKFLGV